MWTFRNLHISSLWDTLNPTLSMLLNRRSKESQQWTLLRQQGKMHKTAFQSHIPHNKQNALTSFLPFILTTILWERQVSQVCYPYFEVWKTDQEKNKSTAKKMKRAKFEFSDTKFRLEDILVETSSFITRLEKQI